MTIRLKLTLWYTGLLCATLILFSVVVYSALSTHLWAQVQQDAVRQVQLVSDAVGNQIRREIALSEQTGRLQLPNLDFFARSVGVQILGDDGKVYLRSSNLGAFPVRNSDAVLESVLAGSNYHHYYTAGNNNIILLVSSVPLKVSGQIVGAVQLIRPVTDVQLALSQTGRYLALGTALCLVLAAIVGAFMARRALAPIDTITETASNISRTEDLAQRLSINDQVSEVGRLAATFNEMLDHIQRLFQSQERLIADVSHELRTPLTTIQGNIQLLQRIAKAEPDSPQARMAPEIMQESLSEIDSESTRMSSLINDLLLLAQADSGALQLQRAPVEMDTLLLEVYRQARRVADHRKGPGALDLRLGHEDQASVLGDRDRLRQLLLNLTENAIKYTPAGGEIVLGLENDAGWVRVSVRDTGIGMSHESQKQIFHRFYRSDKARSRALGGSGLGLSIAEWIAEAHGGHIDVESKLQEGSTFTLWLPELQPASQQVDSVKNQRNEPMPVVANGADDRHPNSDDVEMISGSDAVS